MQRIISFNKKEKNYTNYKKNIDIYWKMVYFSKCGFNFKEKEPPRGEYKEDILVGYRWHDTKKRPARYPFGHGLSYTTFAYGKPTLSGKTIASDGTLTLTLNVTNTGTREGKEVVQLYIGDDKATVLRPVKELKGFEKIALAPGETKQVTFTITPDMLKYWSEEAHDWVAETGKFTAYIGSSSTDIRGKVTFSY